MQGAGIALGLGLGVWEAAERIKASKKGKRQLEINRQFSEQQAKWVEDKWNNLAKPAMVRQQVLERDAQQSAFADSGITTNTGSALVARYYQMRNQNLELTTKDNEIKQQAYITRQQANLDYQAGMIQARVQRMNAIFGGLSTGMSITNAVNTFGINNSKITS